MSDSLPDPEETPRTLSVVEDQFEFSWKGKPPRTLYRRQEDCSGTMSDFGLKLERYGGRRDGVGLDLEP